MLRSSVGQKWFGENVLPLSQHASVVRRHIARGRRGIEKATSALQKVTAVACVFGVKTSPRGVRSHPMDRCTLLQEISLRIKNERHTIVREHDRVYPVFSPVRCHPVDCNMQSWQPCGQPNALLDILMRCCYCVVVLVAFCCSCRILLLLLLFGLRNSTVSPSFLARGTNSVPGTASSVRLYSSEVLFWGTYLDTGRVLRSGYIAPNFSEPPHLRVTSATNQC